MLLGFNRRFAPHIVDGSKRHTIRGKRKIWPKVGEICHCYVDPRQKTMELLGRWPCVKVEEIFIDQRVLSPEATFIDIRIDGVPLSWDEKNALASRDGFSGVDGDPTYALVAMMKFWEGRLPFRGDIIHWDFDHPARGKAKKRRAATNNSGQSEDLRIHEFPDIARAGARAATNKRRFTHE